MMPAASSLNERTSHLEVLLLFINRQTSWAHVDEEDESSHDRCNTISTTIPCKEEGRGNLQSVWKKSYFKKSLVGWLAWTLHQLFANTLNTLRTRTRNTALHLALNPMATITQATKPMTETKTLAMDQVPWMMKPRKRKMRRTRPARRKLKARVRTCKAWSYESQH